MSTPADLHVPTPGTTVGPWLVVQWVDSGSHGTVFLAQRGGLPEAGLFALKMARKARDARFEREADLLQLVRHPAIPRFEDRGVWTSPEGRQYPYLVMEWVEGLTLYEWGREQRRSSREVLQALAQVARGLQAVHASGAIHRDVKGDNIRVAPGGRTVLVDFGSGWWPGARSLTDTIAPPGTTLYRAPEALKFMWKSRRDPEMRWRARPSDDLYALGVAAYRLVTGIYPPPVNEEEEEAPRKLLPPRELATVTLELEAIILRLLSENREGRGSAQEIAEAMERAAQTGAGVDLPIVPTASALPTEDGAPPNSSSTQDSSSTQEQPVQKPRRPSRGKQPERVHRVPASIWLSWASAAFVGSLVATAAGRLSPPESPVPKPGPFLVVQAEPEREASGATGLADGGVDDNVLSSAQAHSRAGMPANALGLPIPKSPFPNQRRPPCDPVVEKAINGGCWALLEKRPPCGQAAFDHEERCYLPAFNVTRLPTSDPP